MVTKEQAISLYPGAPDYAAVLPIGCLATLRDFNAVWLGMRPRKRGK